MVSVALISSIFKKTQEEVGKAVIRYRKMYEKREEPESWIPRVSRNDRRCPNCNSPDVRIGTCGSWYCPSCGNGRRL
jgi:ribosomal protein L37AE/L43A